MKLFVLLYSLFFCSISSFSQFVAGEEVRFSEPYSDDIYVAGGEVVIDAVISGDCLAAGGKIAINDSIAADLIVSGGEIMVNGIVGDDIRAAGGSIVINGEVMDDLIVFGGEIELGPAAVIHGNVVSYGGELEVEGVVFGSVKASGGEITIGGMVHGPASLSAETMIIEDGAEFLSTVSYWEKDGEVDFGDSVKNGEAKYDLSLTMEGSGLSDEGFLIGLSVFLIFVYILGGLIILLLMEWAFSSRFTAAAYELNRSWVNSLGFGLIYVIGFPILIVICFALVIGIPIGIFAAVLYLYSLLFGNFVAALLFTHFWKKRQGKTWSVPITALIAFLVSLALQALTSIPLLGPLFSFALLCLTYGAIILGIKAGKSESPDSLIETGSLS